MPNMVKVADVKEIKTGESRMVTVAGKSIALFNVGGQFYAIDDACTHKSGPLSEGEVDGTTVTCPWHGAQFDLQTGKALTAPAFKGVTSYRVEVEGSDIKVELPS